MYGLVLISSIIRLFLLPVEEMKEYLAFKFKVRSVILCLQHGRDLPRSVSECIETGHASYGSGRVQAASRIGWTERSLSSEQIIDEI